MSRIEPKVGDLDTPFSEKEGVEKAYSGPKSNVDSGTDKGAEAWKPLLYFIVVNILFSILVSGPIKKLYSSEVSSLIFSLIFICSYIGIVWWARCDSIKYHYPLNKAKIYLIVLLGPVGVLIYSFSTRGLLGGMLFFIKMIMYVFINLIAGGIASFVFEKYVL